MWWPFVWTCHFSFRAPHSLARWMPCADGCLFWMLGVPHAMFAAQSSSYTGHTSTADAQSQGKVSKKQAVMCWAVICAMHAMKVSYLPLPDSCRTQPGCQGQKNHPTHPFCSCCHVMTRVNRDRCRIWKLDVGKSWTVCGRRRNPCRKSQN